MRAAAEQCAEADGAGKLERRSLAQRSTDMEVRYPIGSRGKGG